MNINDKSHWQIARMAKTMGMTCTIELDPAQITPRVKSSIKKQLRSGAITMGWQSQAAKIAEQIVGKFELPVSRNMWRGIQVGTVPMNTKARLLEVINADWTAMMLDSPQYAGDSYYRERHDAHTNNLTESKTEDFYLSFFDRVFTEQAQQVLGELLTDDDRHKIEQAIAALDGNDLIRITNQ